MENMTENITQRIAELEKQLEEKNRELEIEASLEKVRIIALGMKEAGDMPDVCRSISQQLESLGIKEIRNVQTAIIYSEKGSYMDYGYFTKHHKCFINEVAYTDHPLASTFADHMMKGNGEIFITHMKGKEVKDWLNYQKGKNVFIDTWLETATSLNFYWYPLGPVALGISTYAPLNENEIQLFKRFRNVFELAYRRYLDIEKAEAQAREAEIELALERIRARTMAMQKSDELSETAYVLFQEFKQLGEIPTQITIGIFNEKDRTIEFRITGANGSGDRLDKGFNLSIEEPTLLRKMYAAYKEQKKSIVIAVTGQQLLDWIRYRSQMSGITDSDPYIDLNEHRFICAGFFSKGLLTFSSKALISEETVLILERFAAVFDQTYTRFLDLKKAEAQAREAHIEAALEKVRSRSMGMRKSEELLEVIKVVAEQLWHLGLKFDNVSFGINDQADDFKFWVAMAGQPEPLYINVPYIDNPAPRRVKEAQKNGIKFFADILTKEENREWTQHFINFSDIKLLSESVKSYILNCEGYARSTFLLNNINLYVGNYHAIAYTEGENNIFKRFSQVFEQTYTRFLDLQKAEAQAREAQIETALEKVRSRTLAMQKSDELADTSAVLFKQLIHLGIAPNRLYIGIIHDNSGEIEFWITDEDGSKVSSKFTGNAFKNPSIKKMYDGWAGQKKWLLIDMHGKELREYFHYLGEELKVPFKGGLSQKRRIQYLTYFSKGFIGMASPDEQPNETVNLLERFAYVFNLTFTRFNDLQTAEAHALQAEQDLIEIKAARKRAEDTLTELQETQKQLIQSEKMASLGELTAGIAHEIQNPLNFVNNFSEVSNEMVDEMKEELKTGNGQLAIEIAEDIKKNLEKILHHGKRADAIVKGMLQHSRTSTGQKEPTDINALCDEYLRLSYHGLRAKDKSFNAEMRTDFDESIGKIDIVPQDIGRVLLNLYNNAFYACAEQSRIIVNEENSKNRISYNPKVSVITKRFEKRVSITVSDNGNGIPQKVLDKIFQPFFTTKPTGEGTGLGLSLSYDILKAHGGEIKVESKEGEGSVFIIIIPV